MKDCSIELQRGCIICEHLADKFSQRKNWLSSCPIVSQILIYLFENIIENGRYFIQFRALPKKTLLECPIEAKHSLFPIRISAIGTIALNGPTDSALNIVKSFRILDIPMALCRESWKGMESDSRLSWWASLRWEAHWLEDRSYK